MYELLAHGGSLTRITGYMLLKRRDGAGTAADLDALRSYLAEGKLTIGVMCPIKAAPETAPYMMKLPLAGNRQVFWPVKGLQPLRGLMHARAWQAGGLTR